MDGQLPPGADEVPTFVYGPVGGATGPVAPPPTTGPWASPPADPPRSPGRSRRLLVVLAVLAVLAAGTVAVVALRDGDDGGSSGAGSSVLGVDGDGPTTEPEQLWQVDLTCGPEDALDPDGYEISSYTATGCEVAVDDDRAYVVTRDDTGAIAAVALDAATGDEVWRTDLDGDEALVTALPGLVVLDGYDADGAEQLTALDPETGEQRWQADGFLTALGEGDTAVVSRTGDEGDFGFVALSLGDGRDRWERPGSELLDVCDGTVYALAGGNTLALDLDSGDERWRDPIGGDVLAKCHGDAVALLDDGQLSVHAATDGEERWSSDLEDLDTLAVIDGVVLVGSGDEVTALDLDDGDERWTAALEVASDADWITGDGTTVLEADDGLVLVDLATGDEITTLPPGDLHTYAFDQGLLVRLDGTTVGGFELGRFTPVWATATSIDGRDVDALALGGGRLFTLTADRLVAYG